MSLCVDARLNSARIPVVLKGKGNATYSKCGFGQLSFTQYKRNVDSVLRSRVSRKFHKCHGSNVVTCAVATGGPSEGPLPASLGFGKELTDVEKFAVSIPAALRTGLGVILAIGAAGAGFGVGGKVQQDYGALAGAVVLGAAGAGAATVISSAGKEGSAKGIFNSVVSQGNPSGLDRSTVVAASEEFGLPLDDERVVEELKELYDRYVSQLMPQGNDPLFGHEVDAIVEFKRALQLDDDIAASVHIELGRRLIRQRLEAGTKDSSIAERKSFQKLVYVSNIVFGEKSKFLLPWKRVFKVTDSQIEIAVADNAKQLLEDAIDRIGADADLEKLRQLRKLQLKYRVTDEVAEELFVQKSRSRIEALLEQAIDLNKARVKNVPKALSFVEQALSYSLSLGALSKEADIIPGVTTITVAGGKYDGVRESSDLKVLYGTFLEDALSGRQLSDDKVEALGRLRNLFGLGTKEADAVELAITSTVYRQFLANAVTSGELEAAESKAAYLEDLCDNLNLDPEEAFKIHEDIYRQKLEICLQDKVLDDEDVKGLQKLTVWLCIPQSTVDSVHAVVCGKIFGKLVEDALGSGVGGYDPLLQDAVKAAVKGLRLPLPAAIDVVREKAKKSFLMYARKARGLSDMVDAGRELKKLVMFSNLTVSQLLDDVKIACGVPVELIPQVEEPEETEVERELTEKERQIEERIAKMEKIYQEEYGAQQSLRKTPPKKREVVKLGKPQREVTLTEELELRDRQDLYEKFLLYAITGERVQVGYAMKVGVQKDEKDLVRLQQLGDILGLLPAEIAVVQQKLSERAFRQQAESLLSDGQLNERKAQQLKDLQQKVGLADEVAQKVVKGITTGKMAGAISSAVQKGQFSISDVQGLKAAGMDIASIVGKPARIQLFKKLVAKELSAGNGEFNAELVGQQLPVDLSLSVEETSGYLVEAANEKLKDSLVQAVSMLRQKEKDQVLYHLSNLLASDKANPVKENLSWAVKEELLDLYGVYVSQEPVDESKESRLRTLLDIDESTAESLKDMAAKGSFNLSTKSEDFVF